MTARNMSEINVQRKDHKSRTMRGCGTGVMQSEHLFLLSSDCQFLSKLEMRDRPGNLALSSGKAGLVSDFVPFLTARISLSCTEYGNLGGNMLVIISPRAPAQGNHPKTRCKNFTSHRGPLRRLIQKLEFDKTLKSSIYPTRD